MRTNRTEQLRRVKELQLIQNRRRVIQLETLIAEFDRVCIVLGHQIAADEKHARNYDPMNFAYPTSAKAARERRTKLQRSADALRIELKKLTCEATEPSDRQFAARLPSIFA